MQLASTDIDGELTMKIATAGCLMMAALTLIASQSLAQQVQDNAPPLRWWKGNLHTHSLWSDGNEFPEMIADWYVVHDYNFLAFSDHNVLSNGMRWMSMEEILQRAEPQVLEDYRQRFGNAWVETRGKSGSPDFAVRLKPLNEFGPLFNQAGKFLLLAGEEISDSAQGKPVHMNATNVAELIRPVGGTTVREAMQNNLRAVLEQEQSLGRQILPHLNHPNFGYAVTAEDLAAVVQERFFEVYNGHPLVNQLGDEEHPSIERMWDIANTIRLTQLDAEPLLGIATDDSHEYHGRPGAHTGRGWVMVRSRYLTPDHLILALKAGDFYASSGVMLNRVEFEATTKTLELDIAGAAGASYETKFIATLVEEAEGQLPSAERIGQVVDVVSGLQPTYQMTGKELYVRALVTSSLAHPDPSLPDQKQQAWTQPVGW